MNIRADASTLVLSLVVPIFNEIEAIDLFIERVESTFINEALIKLEIIFVNDGSTDKTLDHLLQHQKNNALLKVVDLSRNFGKEAALTAGLQSAEGDIIVPMDVDLQDPPELIIEMIARWREGYDVVLAKRINRDSDAWIKRISASWFYRIHNMIATPKIPENVGDFRLMDRCVVEALKQLPESHRFMKGLFAWAGFKTTQVNYIRPKRAYGKTKFNTLKLWNFALEGLTSFSVTPLRTWIYAGFLVAFSSFIFSIFILLKSLIYGVDVPGYASLIVAITFLGGLQLMGIGVLGEYIGRTYTESKRRPIFLIRHIYKTEKI